MTNKILEGRKPTKEESDIVDYFVEMHRNQLTYLSEAGKRIVEIISTFFGLLFIAIAFGKDYPPPYLQDNISKFLVILTMSLLSFSFAFALWTASPFKVSYRNLDLVSMRDALEATIFRKSQVLRVAGFFFFTGLVVFNLFLIFIFTSNSAGK